MKIAKLKIENFRDEVWKHWRKNGRHSLPWRRTRNPYRILVSEVMLQQTRVPRVIGKYKEFLRAFPTVQKLAAAKLSDVLKVWSGLGYNRRGKYLRDAAKEIVAIGNIKEALAGPLPGVGPYTRAAVRVFAFNEPLTMIETNIRTVYIHHLVTFLSLSGRDKLGISDVEIVSYAKRAAEGQDPREWHWALMDYGSYLKRIGVRNNSRSAHYTKQSKFEGSLRQVRGAILRTLYSGQKTKRELMMEIRSPSLKKALDGLARDGLIVKEKGKWRIA